VRTQKVYYTVFGLKDGTVYLANLTRKPRKTKYSSRPQIDEDGICRWYIEKEVVPKDLPDWAKGAWHTALAPCLNVKRIVRQQVEPRLEPIEREVHVLRAQMERVEKNIDRLLSRAKDDPDLPQRT
jgi:hypothetical protein